MLRINISKDIESFDNSNFGGFTLGQIGVFAIALAVCVPVFLISYYVFGVPLTLCTYIAMPFGIAIGFLGLSKKDGMTIWQRRKVLKDYYKNRGKALYYVSTETYESYQTIARRQEENKASSQKKDGELKKMILLLFGVVISFVIIALIIVIYKFV